VKTFEVEILWLRLVYFETRPTSNTPSASGPSQISPYLVVLGELELYIWGLTKGEAEVRSLCKGVIVILVMLPQQDSIASNIANLRIFFLQNNPE
jgi:hypothetical protein